VPVSVSSDTVSSAGRAAHDVAVGALIGGNIFARVGMHPAVSAVSDPRERGQVVNEAWSRFGTVNAFALGTIVAAWAGARLDEASNPMLSPRERPLAAAKDAAVIATTLTGIAAGIAGQGFARMEPEGAVALEDGDHAAPQASAAQQRMKRLVNVVGSLNLASAVALASVNAALAQANFRRPPARRFLRRRY
jgi:hypothetical protein